MIGLLKQQVVASDRIGHTQIGQHSCRENPKPALRILLFGKMPCLRHSLVLSFNLPSEWQLVNEFQRNSDGIGVGTVGAQIACRFGLRFSSEQIFGNASNGFFQAYVN